MNDNALKFASYWRNSLADAERNNGTLNATELKTFLRQPGSALHSGILDEQAAAQCFTDEPEHIEHVQVSLRPCLFSASLEHGTGYTGLPRHVTPVVTEALLSRDGRLWPSAMTHIPRDILEPLESGSFAISTVAAVDAFMGHERQLADPDWSEPENHARHWADYRDYLARLLRAICADWPGEHDAYRHVPELLLQKKQAVTGASRHILALYDDLRHSRPDAPLFDRYAALDHAPPQARLPSAAGFAERLAHSHAQYPLADAQRDALSHLLLCPEGDILAVNGPPGTGKTTLLLSVIATLWAKAALAGPEAEPPVIVASSTNNQAVTNILDAFAKDFSSGSGPFAGRWLPQPKSFGAYLPAQGKEAEAFPKYQTAQFFNALETRDGLAEAKAHYLQKAALAFPEAPAPSVAQAVEWLRQRIVDAAGSLRALASAWAELSQARQALQQALAEQGDSAERRQRLSRQRDACHARQERLQRYLAQEPLLLALFGWLPAIARKRAACARLALHDAALPALDADQQGQAAGWRTLGDIETALATWSAHATFALDAEARHQQSLDQLAQTERLRLAAWTQALEALGPDFAARAAEIDLAGCDAMADTRLRFPIFLLTSHYWEGRWLLEMQEKLGEIEGSAGRTGKASVIPRWRRWMKITPCVVSTFYMLPRKLGTSRPRDGGWKTDYLYGFADLLIVDEAGQVQPEVAGASFALARKALVIGDTEQIEPICSNNTAVDKGNLVSAGLLASSADEAGYQRLASLGKSAASGSVMQIAQSASRYHYDTRLARGMYLYEHRRCYDGIVDYCNDLCYQGLLQPMRGNPQAPALPTLGYLHVAGICQRAQGRSRHNLLEAETIAAWLAEQRPQLEARYGKDLSRIVGIVTPFGAQTRAIEEACAAHGIDTGKGEQSVTVGTVHALQGAARPLILFSAVYSRHADGGFIDQRRSMLNVAVSRAEDSFLVFGDMDLFSLAQPGSPRALLARYLFARADNELLFAPSPRSDLLTPRTGLSHLHDAEEHDRFLLGSLARVAREIHIVSPWLKLARIRETGALAAMTAAAQRRVQVHVYTDRAFNLGDDEERLEARAQALEEAFAALRNAGIRTHALQRVHSKLLMADDELLCVGSFNWFSASRQPGYSRHETSMVYRGPDVAEEIETNLGSLARLMAP
ncbi:AAA domain-containing protein [Stutzerimonas kirkiae]|uniref:AAA domain-containing protein n=1 Tax=Stutzerimonas kirkiae TaxID=2211392 RepID=UPI0010383E70|nr:AAA domain-containing protein [Stutzerimonas kirkiae]TBV10977.1 phospholipase [Stutzerimonas kirkiae]